MSKTNGQRELTLAKGVRFTPTALILPEKLPYEGWRECGRFLRCSHTAIMYWRADWLRHARASYGAKKVAEAIEQLELDLGPLKKADALNRLVERQGAQRRASLCPACAQRNGAEKLARSRCSRGAQRARAAGVGEARLGRPFVY